jgi:chromosome segregation ATPase
MLPLILATVGAAAVGSAVTYYFVSNDGNIEQVKYLSTLETALKALLEKAEKLKAAKQFADAQAKAVGADAQKWRDRCDQINEELAKALAERDEYAAEIKRWRESDGGVVSGIAVIGMSKVLYDANFSHETAMKNLKERIDQIRNGPLLPPLLAYTKPSLLSWF